ncbi:MAG: c-type cytochrome [Planctomycetes bacterium]|nr:c-type cytochrome [Planctomycetota bacterium]
MAEHPVENLASIGSRRLLAAWLIAAGAATALSQDVIPKPDDAPPPLEAEESLWRIRVPEGFRLELVASEPLVREPSGVCWDERGRLFVCELHGYNLEGQYDIEALNRTGQLDRIVRRIQADEGAKAAAKAGTYGTVKRLVDSDGDGRFDRSEVWADRLPPCYGICPARGGAIVACAPDIVYLADRDGDGEAEVREMIFSGFPTGPLERGINGPQWGIDGWIYFGRGHGGGRITGPHLAKPVNLPNTDFRIRADGSAIEPVSGGTGTIGFCFTESGERFVASTRSPLFVAPLPWRYLARNADVAAPRLEQAVLSDQRVYPISRPHPWRSRRARDPGFSRFYTERYGQEETAPNGYFTSACSPLVYRDRALPGLEGQLLLCEPAQNLVHRAIVERDGLRVSLRRVPEESASEFLASSDPWFHPIVLSHGPDGAVWIVDFYREIIEDYSAIPRYLQQQYGLVRGQDRGRIYRLVHEQMLQAPPADMSRLSTAELVREIAGPWLWRRQTAARLLAERHEAAAAEGLEQVVREAADSEAVLKALYTLESLGSLRNELLVGALAHAAPAVRLHALRLADVRFVQNAALLEAALGLIDDPSPEVGLQLALSLGESREARTIPALARLARERDVDWLHDAVLSSVAGRAGRLLAELLQGQPPEARTADRADPPGLGHARQLLGPLCAAIASRRDPQELSAAIELIASVRDQDIQANCLEGLRSRFESPVELALNEAARRALKRLATAENRNNESRSTAQALVGLLRLESPAERRSRLSRAARALTDPQLPAETRLTALEQFAVEPDPGVISTLADSFAAATPQLRSAILDAAFARRDRLPVLVEALEQRRIPVSALTAAQRRLLIEHTSGEVQQRADRLFEQSAKTGAEDLPRYLAALKAPRNTERGEKVFRERCADCHQAHGIGFALGPDLTAEFQRAEETIIRDILAPGDAIASGYAGYTIVTNAGRILNGLIAGESANSLLVRQPRGTEFMVLRKDIELLKASAVSLMPEDLVKVLTPEDAADVIAWLRQPPSRLMLLDDDPALAAALNEGAGTAAFVADDKFVGRAALRVTPPQRYSPRIAGWSFRIRKEPSPGEFRYLRFAWKADGAHGVMIELADNGAWPSAGEARCRYYAGRNTTGWQAIEIAAEAPGEWTVVTRDLWKDFGDSELTGIAPTAMGGDALFDAVELLRTLDESR